MHFQSSVLQKIPNLLHGFGSAQEPIPLPFSEIWKKNRPQWKQVHQNHFIEVTQKNQECGEVDALWTQASELPIGVVTADCVPILLARKDGEKIAALHAGWRGTYAHILENLWKTFSTQGEKAQDWVGAIGPAISGAAYEVSEEIAQNFRKEFSYLEEREILPQSRHLDLQKVNRGVLMDLGFHQVEILPLCTFSHETQERPTFHSYRRGNQGARQWSVIMKKI